MHIQVLGSGAGGGFPQWNCNCTNCRRYRTGTFNGQGRSQSSIAVSANGSDWILFNASPDIRSQLAAFPAMQPGRAIRDTAICAIVLIDAQIDHTTGLMMLREHKKPLVVYCTNMVYQDLTTGYPLFRVLEHYCGVDWHTIPVSGSDYFTISKAPGLRFTAVPLRSEAPPYSPHRHNSRRGDNIGVRIEDTATGKRLFYAPGLGVVDATVMLEMEQADCLLVDGTVWSDDELERHDISTRRAHEMGHLHLGGADGMLEILRKLDQPRKILIHINNTNPILDEDSPEYREVLAAGVEVAHDGLCIDLNA